MISVSKAKKYINERVAALPPVTLLLKSTAGLVLAEDVLAKTDIPAFDQSSMDGYAFSFHKWQSNKLLPILGLSAAGSNEKLIVTGANAVRIFTGAPVPEGTDTVVMQEKTKVENNNLQIVDDTLQKGANVCIQGTDIKLGEIALEKGTLLTPAAIGFLAGVGVDKVSVHPNPLISVILTGNELQQPGLPLTYGQVYESNSYSLLAALELLQIRDVKILYAEDELNFLKEQLEKALQQSDIVLLTGGISVGDYDFVLEASRLCGVETIFHKIKQRPGKPLFFGKKSEKLVFGLPGNPSSVLTCFYEYVVPAIRKIKGDETIAEPIYATLEKNIQKSETLTCFLKGLFNGKTVTPLDAQESYRLSSFAKANCLIQINEGINKCDAGEIVEIHLINK